MVGRSSLGVFYRLFKKYFKIFSSFGHPCSLRVEVSAVLKDPCNVPDKFCKAIVLVVVDSSLYGLKIYNHINKNHRIIISCLTHGFFDYFIVFRIHIRINWLLEGLAVSVVLKLSKKVQN